MRIALVAHDSRKKELVEWVTYNMEELKKHELFATGTTGRLLKEIEGKIRWEPTGGNGDGSIWSRYCEYPLEDKVTCLKSGPLGGDQEIGAMIAEGKLDVLIFFCDNLIQQGHQNDVSALTRLASLYNIAFATNRTTADMILTSSLFNNEKYKKVMPNCIQEYISRSVF